MNTLFSQILNITNNAVAFFNNEYQLKYYNNLIENIWDIPPNILDYNIEVIEFFEILRERQVYPPQENFSDFCKKILNYFTTLKQPLINNLILSNGKNYEENIIPYQNGLIFIWSDNTKLWESIYNLNNYKNLYTRIINSLPLPIIIVGTNGIIENYNSLFCNYFKINKDIFTTEIHISKLLKHIEYLHNKEEITAYLSGLMLSRKDINYTLNLLNGLTIEINGFPLPNGNNFIIFRNFNNVSPRINFSKIKTSLQELQTTLILELEKYLNTPINTIIGFADLLKEGYLGNLNIKQHEYISKIINQAEIIKNELNYKAELTLYQNTNTIEFTTLDINNIVVNSLQQTKSKLQSKNINVKLNLINNIANIKTNQAALTKLFTLTLLYLIEQNAVNSTIEITINSSPLTISFKDTCTLPLFSPLEINEKLDLILILKNLELLQGSYKVLTQNRAFRTLIFTFNQ